MADNFDLVLKINALNKSISDVVTAVKKIPKNDNTEVIKALKYVVVEQMKTNTILNNQKYPTVDFTETNRLLSQLIECMNKEEEIVVKLTLV